MERRNLPLLRSATAATASGLFDFLCGFLSEVRILVRAEQHLFALSHIGKTLGEVLLHGFLHLAGSHHLVQAALLLDSEELLPCLLRNRVGQVLDIERARCGVNYLIEVCLFLEQQLLIAGDTLCELSRLLVGYIERSNDYLVHACDSRRHGLGLRAKQVHIRVEDGHVEAAGLGAHIHLRSLFECSGEERCFVCLYNLRPQQTGSTELSNLHEVVTTDTHVEADGVRCLVVRHACFGEHGHVFCTPCECVCQFLCAVRTGIVQDNAIHAYYTIARERLRRFHHGSDLRAHMLAAEQLTFQ